MIIKFYVDLSEKYYDKQLVAYNNILFLACYNSMPLTAIFLSI